MENIAGILFPGIGAMLGIGLGLPLALRKVKPNYIFGYWGTSYVVNCEDLWYAVNEMGGKHSVIIGCILAVIAIYATFFIGRPEIQVVLSILALVYFLLGSAFSLWKVYSLIHKKAKGDGLKSDSNFA